MKIIIDTAEKIVLNCDYRNKGAHRSSNESKKLKTMKTKSSPNLWEATATNPKKPEWHYLPANRVSRKRFNNRKSPKSPKVRTTRILPEANPDVIITQSSVSLESLGLNFSATRIRAAHITG